MSNSISNRQMVLLIFLSMTTYNVVTIANSMARAAGRGGWLPLLAAAFIFAVIAVIITKLGGMFEGQMLFDYSKQIVGAFFAYVIALYFILYFMIVFVYLHVQIIDLLKVNFLPRTPKWATALSGIIVFGFIANKGIRNVARLFEIIAPIFIVVSVCIYCLALFQGREFNLLPLFESSRMWEYADALKKSVVPFLGLELLLVIPFTPQNKKVPKLMFFTVLLVGLYYILVLLSNIKILGVNAVMYYQAPLVEALKLVQIPILERVDILYQTIGFCGLFLGTIIVYTAIVELFCKMFAKSNRAIVVAVTGAVLYALVLVSNLIKHPIPKLVFVIAVLGLLSSALIPAILYVIAKVKNYAQKTL